MINSGAWSNVVVPFRERDFRLIWSGNLVSRLGDGIFTVGIALEALLVDHQPTGLAYVLASRAVPGARSITQSRRPPQIGSAVSALYPPQPRTLGLGGGGSRPEF
jgi:hypothetical protein